MGKRLVAAKSFLIIAAFLMLSYLMIPAIALAETNDEILERLEELSDITQKQEREIERLEKELKESISDVRKERDKAIKEQNESEEEEADAEMVQGCFLVRIFLSDPGCEQLW
jgi:hypothetical protein